MSSAWVGHTLAVFHNIRTWGHCGALIAFGDRIEAMVWRGPPVDAINDN